MRFCFYKVREQDCFCFRYDENRQTMFYCGFFTALAGFIWFLVGFGLRWAFFSQTFGPEVNAVACGIMVVGIMVLVVGLVSTLSTICTGKTHNKTNCISSSLSSGSSGSRFSSSSSSGRHHRRHEKMISFDSPMNIKHGYSSKSTETTDSSCRSSGSFSSVELNPSSAGSANSSASSSSSSSHRNHHHNNSQRSFNSNIAFIA